MSGSENTRKRIEELDKARERESSSGSMCVRRDVCNGSNATSMDYVAADLDALASRLARIEAMPDIAQRLEQGRSLAGSVGASSAVTSASPAPPAADEEIVEAIARVVYRVEMDCEESAATADEEGVAVARAVLAALRARGSVVR